MNDKEAVIAGLRNMARDRQYKNHRQGRTGGFFGGVLNPDPTVNLRPGRIWVREGEDGRRAQSEALIVGVVDTVADIPVWLAETVEGGELCVLGPVVTTRNLESWGGGLPGTGVPRVPSVLATGYVKTDNILAGRVSPSTSHPASLYVTIGLFWAFGRLLGGIEHDVGSANVPGSANEHRWCMVCVDKDNSAYTLTGTEYVRTSANELLLDTTDVDIEIPAGYVPTGLVSLSYGQTDISESRFEDVRHWITSPSTLLSESAETLTLSSGAATADGGSYFILAAQTGTADDLDTLTVAGPPRMVLLQADSGDTITVKHSTGNIELNGEDDYALSGDKTLALFWDGANLSDIGAASPPTTLTVEEVAGTPTVANVTKIVVSNGTLTDDGSGQVTLDLMAGMARRYLMIYNYRPSAGLYPQLGLGSSADGRTFIRDTEPVIALGTSGQFDDDHQAHPCLVKGPTGVLHMYYGGYDGTNYSVGLARSWDGGETWTKYGQVLAGAAGPSWEDSAVSWARVIYDEAEGTSGKKWKMWYAGDANGVGGIGYAYSADGISWTKYASNPVLGLGTGGNWDDAAIIPNSVVRLGDTYYLFYNGLDTLVTPTYDVGVTSFTNPESSYANAASPILSGDAINSALASNVTAGATTATVSDSSVFPIGAPVWVFDADNWYLTRVVSRNDSTNVLTLADAAPATVSTTGGNVRSVAFNSVSITSAIYDGGWRFWCTGFQPGFNSSEVMETSFQAFTYELDAAYVQIDYGAGLVVPITVAESDEVRVSWENASVLDTHAETGRFASEPSGGSSVLTVEEVDGTPTVSGVTTIVVTNGTLTDDGGGQITLDLSGSGGGGSFTGDIMPSQCDGRLTLESGVAISTTDQTAKTSVYFTPYLGDKVALYDGANWDGYSFTERTLSLAGLTASLPHDIFLYDNAGTLTLEAVAWTNTTTRATALTTVAGVYVKNGATTYRYLGTICTTGSTGQCEDSEDFRGVWNCYHRVPRKLKKIDTANSWTYATAAWRSWNNSTANRVEFVIGLNEEPVYLAFAALAGSSAAPSSVGIALDATNASHADVTPFINALSGAALNGTSIYNALTGIGYHYLQLVEWANSGTVTFYGDAGVTYAQLGATGHVFA